MGFGNRVRQQGKETYKLELTNKNYKYYKLLESSKKVVGPVSTQALVDWRLAEWGDEFIGVYTDANIVMGAESADFFFYWWYTKVLADDGIWYVPGGIHYYSQDYVLKTLQNFDVGIWGRTPELNAVCPDGFEWRRRMFAYVNIRLLSIACICVTKHLTNYTACQVMRE
jgi:hypothetical protein